MSDQLFRRAKIAFKRKPTNKPPHERILIACEGEVAEPLYFKALRSELRLNNTVDIIGEECGSAPASVYKYTLKILKEDGDYDRAYCVFDKDNHESYVATLDAIRRNKKLNIIPINSVPCFEFWVLLHFELTASPFSNSAELTKRIKKHWKEYNKEKVRDIYPYIKSKTDDAVKNSIVVSRNAQSDNPSTMVHVLVNDLIGLSKKINS